MAHQRKPASLIPDDVKARRQTEAEQARQEYERNEAAQQERNRLVAAGNLVEASGAAYELELKADKEYLRRWVEAMAAYKAVLTAWPNPNVPPAGAEHRRDDWLAAATIFLAVDADPSAVVAELADMAATGRNFAGCVAAWLRRGIRQVCEGYWMDPTLPPAPSQPELSPEQHGQEAGVKKRRRCYDRDHQWLSWANEGLKPAAIRNRWNEQCKNSGGDPISGGRAGRDSVKQGLTRARRESDSGG